ncbi:MAG: OB-fold nucleic acid binding domain-containing protein, partial [Candidatus Bathyarchaeota archaeon]|nr:OB-fold nucleic acid binding domain-containing protein [Candidatus Bathyarchaeota archaeon]
MSFTSIQEILEGKRDGECVRIRGWVYRKRESRKTIFLVIRDSTGTIQCTVKERTKGWAEAERITIESSTIIHGTVKKDKRAPDGFEVSTKEMEIIGLAERFPISKDLSEEFIRDIRHLWLRSRRMNLIMRLRSRVLDLLHEFFRESGFIEVSPPMFITSACEGGATLFSAKYFDSDLYLTQSAQLYSEVLIYSLEKVYTCAPSFRAEKSRTIRHLCEYWHVEPEWAFADMNDVIRVEEELISFICRSVLENNKREFSELKVDTEKLREIEPPFPRITYTQSIEQLQNKGFDLKWGEDLGFDEEKALADDFEKPFFVFDYPR